MARRRWSIELDQGSGGHSAGLLATRSERILVSSHEPHRCRAFAPDGELLWTVTGMNATREAPGDGIVVTGQDPREMLLLDRDGAVQRRWWFADQPMHLLGWRGAEPILSPRWGAWVEPFVYRLDDWHLLRYDEAGHLQARIAVSREPFVARMQERWGASPAAERLVDGTRFVVQYHPRRHRLLAHDISVHGATLCLRLDASVEWLTWTQDSCCPSLCIVGDEVTVRTAGCAGHVYFLAVDGAVLRRHEIRAIASVASERGTVFTVAHDAVHAFGPRGEPLYTLDAIGVVTAAVHDASLYTVSQPPGGHELTAFDV